MKVFINQEENYKAEFGEVLRSSAIFWVKSGPNFKSCISFMNYWKLKRNLKVSVIATVRKLDGTLLKREHLTFDQGYVINYDKFAEGEFEGSVEIDVFALENMVIPYAAIMIVYETPNGVSMVHAYTRTYSRYEVEDKKTITNGEEGCWLLKDTDNIQSFGIIHNGAQPLKDQHWTLTVTNHKGEKKTADVFLPLLKPFETIKLITLKYIPYLTSFLDGQHGSATLSFALGESFTRMLVGHETLDGKDIQVTHSNFNYSKHQTNILTDTSVAIMYMPKMPDLNMFAVIYPDAEPGDYNISKGKEHTVFHSGHLLAFLIKTEKKAEFTKVGGGLPSRIVTAIEGRMEDSKTLPFECSLGVITKKRPPKKLWWGLLSNKAGHQSRLLAIPMTDIYAEINPDTKISIALYGQNTHEKLEKHMTYSELKNIDEGIFFKTLFPEMEKVTENKYAYYTFYSEYPGFWVYSSIQNEFKSLTLEHGF